MKRYRDGWRRLAAFLVAVCLAMGMFPASAMAGDAPASAGGMFGSVTMESDGTLKTQGGVSASWNAGALTVGPKAIMAAPDGARTFYWGGSAMRDVSIRAMADNIMAGMSLGEKISQLLVLESDTLDPSAIQSMADSYLWAWGFWPVFGGVSLSAKAFEGISYEDAKAAIAAIAALQQDSHVPMLIAANEEGGDYAAVSGNPGIRDEAFLSPRELYYQAIIDSASSWVSYEDMRDVLASLGGAQAADMADLLLGLGIDMNLGVVADTAEGYAFYSGDNKAYVSQDSSSYMYSRAWPHLYEVSIDGIVAEVVAGMEGNGLGTAMRHFPGYGPSAKDSREEVVEYHSNRPTLDDTYGHDPYYFDDSFMDGWLLDTRNRKVFDAGVGAGGEAVVMSNAVYDFMDPANSASVSPAAYAMLRDDMGFDGLAIAELPGYRGVRLGGRDYADLEADASRPDQDRYWACLAAIYSGADMVVMPSEYEWLYYNMMHIYSLLAYASDGSYRIDGRTYERDVFLDRIDEACRRVLCWKLSHGVIDTVTLTVNDIVTDADGRTEERSYEFSFMNGAVLADLDLAVSLDGAYYKMGGRTFYSDSGRSESFSMDEPIYEDTTLYTYSYEARIHDIRIDPDGSESEDVLSFVVPGDMSFGDAFAGMTMPNRGSGLPVDLADCALYKHESSERLELSDVMDKGVELDTYYHVLVLNYMDKSYSTRVEEYFVREEMLLDSGLRGELGGKSFNADIDGVVRAVSFDSLMASGMDRSYSVNRVLVIDENGAEASYWGSAGCEAEFEVAAAPGYRWDVYEGKDARMDARKVYQAYVAGSGEKRMTIRVMADKPLLVKRSEARAEGRYYLCVPLDNKIQILETSYDVNGPALFGDGKAYMYASGSRLADTFGKFGFDPAAYGGKLMFASSRGGNYDKFYAQAAPVKGDDGWRVPFAFSDAEKSYDGAYLLYLASPLGSANGSAMSEKDILDHGFWSVYVYDYAHEGLDDDATHVEYVAHKGSITLHLPVRTDDKGKTLDWTVSDSSMAYVVKGTPKNGYIDITLSNVQSYCVLSCGVSANTSYTVQYFAYTDELSLYTSSQVDTTKSNRLQMIDTSVYKNKYGSLPTNANASDSASTRYIQVNSDSQGIVNTYRSTLKRIYKDRTYLYVEAPTILHCDRLYSDGHYDMSQLWVYTGDGFASKRDSTSSSGWTVYVAKGSSGGRVMNVTDLRDVVFSTDKSYVDAHPDTSVLIDPSSKSVVRFVYTATESNAADRTRGVDEIVDITAFDYDVMEQGSNGLKIYGDTYFRSEASGSASYGYVNTNMQGINSYSTKQLAFGNQNVNANVTQRSATFGNYWINIANGKSNPSGKQTFQYCSFGLVNNKLDSNGHLQYNVTAPDLFGETKSDSQVNGRTTLSGYSLGFVRTGDAYTLTKAFKGTSTVLDNLDRLPLIYNKGDAYIYSNEFWLLDDAYTSSQWKYHDVKFGNGTVTYDGKTIYMADSSGKQGNLAENDSSASGNSSTLLNRNKSEGRFKNHNSYFGMKFEIEFSLQPDYVGNLDYAFFGDDDMWVFLDGEQILDIGGVHSAAGEYVDLWDYIKYDTHNGTKKLINRGNGGCTEVTDHKLTFYYMERGASGSTCWMRFTIPEARFVERAPFTSDKFSSVWLSKDVDPNGNEVDGETVYPFELQLDYKGDDYRYDHYDAEGNLIGSFVLGDHGIGTVELRAGEKIMLWDVPVGTGYTVREVDGVEYRGEFEVDGAFVGYDKASGKVGKDDVYIICTNVYYENSQSLVPNAFEMPHVGGPGVGTMYVAGVSMAALAGAAYAVRKRRRNACS